MIPSELHQNRPRRKAHRLLRTSHPQIYLRIQPLYFPLHLYRRGQQEQQRQPWLRCHLPVLLHQILPLFLLYLLRKIPFPRLQAFLQTLLNQSCLRILLPFPQSLPQIPRRLQILSYRSRKEVLQEPSLS